MKKRILHLLFCLCTQIQAQTTDSLTIGTTRKNSRYIQAFEDHNLIITTAIHFGNYSSFEISLSRGYSWSSGGFPGSFNQYGIGMEFYNIFPAESNIIGNELIYAPKISFELDPFLPPICLSRLNLLYVTDFANNASIKYRHEVGFSYLGILNVNYGYSFNITNNDFVKVKHSVSIQWNIFWGERKWDNWN
jgi:hypothetical protein